MAQLRSPFPILGVRQKATLSLMNRRIEKAHRQVPNIDRIIITWGTAYVFRLKETGKVVANCHKQPASIFDRVLLSVDEIVSRWRDIIKHIENNLPQCRILFTVSPIRHLSDGAHGNQIKQIDAATGNKPIATRVRDLRLLSFL